MPRKVVGIVASYRYTVSVIHEIDELKIVVVHQFFGEEMIYRHIPCCRFEVERQFLIRRFFVLICSPNEVSSYDDY